MGHPEDKVKRLERPPEVRPHFKSSNDFSTSSWVSEASNRFEKVKKWSHVFN